MKIIDGSHVDHEMTDEQRDYILSLCDGDAAAEIEDKLKQFGVAVVTFELPEELGTVPCGLYGPQMGDDPVPESEVRYDKRPGREWESRLVERPMRQDRRITVIAGPHGEEPCVLYTMFGGTPGHREPADPSLTTPEAVADAKEFWATHALVG